MQIVKIKVCLFIIFSLFFMQILIAQDKVSNVLHKSYIWAPVDTSGNGDLHVVFRKEIKVINMPVKAVINIFAYNRFTLYINGRYVTRGPVRFENKQPEYYLEDITPFLKTGKNDIAVIVHRYEHNGRIMNHTPGFTALIQIIGQKGNYQSFKTDGSWKVAKDETFLGRPSNWSSIRENIDARKMPANYIGANFNDDHWENAITLHTTDWPLLHKQGIPSLRETEIKGLSINGKLLSASLPLQMNAGDSIMISIPAYTQAYFSFDMNASENAGIIFGDKNGLFNNTYQAYNGNQTYTTDDTYASMGFYIKLNSGHVRFNNIHVVERLYPFTQIGKFECNDTSLNHLYKMLTRSLQILSEDAYVDCAARERVEWMDDDPPAFDVTRTAMMGPDLDGKKMYADARLLISLLRRTALTLTPDGRIKAHTSSDRWDIHGYMEDRACDWVEGIRRYYESTGDKELVIELWKPLMKQLQWFLSHRTNLGLVKAREWVIWGNPMGYQTCEGTALNAFVYKSLKDGAFLGKVIGKDQDAVYLKNASKQLYTSINKYLWDGEKGTYLAGHFDNDSIAKVSLDARKSILTFKEGYVEPTFEAALFAIDQELVPVARMDSVKEYMMQNRKGNYTVMAYYYLFKQMYNERNVSMDKEVLDMMREKWRAVLNSKWQVSSEGFGAGFNAHIYGIFPPYFLSSYVLGVRLDGPIWDKKLLIEPHLGDLKKASGIVVTEYGPVPVLWKKEGESLKFTITIPKGVKASLQFPSYKEFKKVFINGKLTNYNPKNKNPIILQSGNYYGQLN